MENKSRIKKEKRKKGFFAAIMDKLDKKMEEQSKKSGCCGNAQKGKGKSCC